MGKQATMIKLSFGDKLKVFFQKLTGANKSAEGSEFIAQFRQVELLRKQLKNVERGINEWIKHSAALSKSAIYLSQQVETDQETHHKVASDLQIALEDRSTQKSIHQKLAMLDSLVTDRNNLVTLRLLRDRAEKKLEAARGKSVVQEKLDDLILRKTKAAERYEGAHAELLAALKFVNDEAYEKGHCSLISPELAAFKLAQFQFFLNCQKIIQGSDKDDAKNLNEEWNTFSTNLAKKRESAKLEAVNLVGLEAEKESGLRKSETSLAISPETKDQMKEEEFDDEGDSDEEEEEEEEEEDEEDDDDDDDDDEEEEEDEEEDEDEDEDEDSDEEGADEQEDEDESK